jgi:hypothetical protein
MENTTVARGWKTSARGALALFFLGMVGVVALAVYSVPTLRATPGLEELSYPLLLVVASVNSAILLAVFAAIGAATAPRVDLRSHLFAWATGRDAEWQSFRESLPLAVGVGAALFFIIAVLEAAFAPFVTLDTGGAVSDAESLRALAASVPMRLFYGGITEEVLLRWGLMAPLAWVGWRLSSRFGRSRDRPSAATMWGAIVLSAVLFGAGHLPAAATSFGLTPALIARIVVLNTVAGISFGWLFWQRSLETAMVAHAMFHVTLLSVSTALIVLT